MTTTVPIHPLPEILLLTHGGWGLQLCNSLRMVMGEIEGVTEIALMPVDTLGEFLPARRSRGENHARRFSYRDRFYRRHHL